MNPNNTSLLPNTPPPPKKTTKNQKHTLNEVPMNTQSHIISKSIINHNVKNCKLLTLIFHLLPPVDLYLISEKSIWKNQVRQTGFLVYFELDFYCLCSLQKSVSKLIFAGKNSSSLKLIFTTWFFKNQVQINSGLATYLLYWALKNWLQKNVEERWLLYWQQKMK